MTPLPLVIHPDVGLDLNSFAKSYEYLVRGLGTQFVLEVDLVFGRIALLPRSYQCCFGEFRRALLDRFPFAIGFRVTESAIYIDGIFPTKASPHRITDLLNARAGSSGIDE